MLHKHSAARLSSSLRLCLSLKMNITSFDSFTAVIFSYSLYMSLSDIQVFLLLHQNSWVWPKSPRPLKTLSSFSPQSNVCSFFLFIHHHCSCWHFFSSNYLQTYFTATIMAGSFYSFLQIYQTFINFLFSFIQLMIMLDIFFLTNASLLSSLQIVFIFLFPLTSHKYMYFPLFFPNQFKNFLNSSLLSSSSHSSSSSP